MHKPFQIMRFQTIVFVGLLGGLLLGACQDHRLSPTPAQLQVSPFATGFKAPIGLATGPDGTVYVSEVGTGQNDGRVSLITPTGQVYPVATGFPSAPDNTGQVAGLTHLAYRDGILWILHGATGTLYKASIAGFGPGSTPYAASALATEDVGTIVKTCTLPECTGESNAYNLTFVPNGDLYITDAAANAIVRRKADGTLSLFATLPSFKNPTPGAPSAQAGPPFIQAVPTGIIFDGTQFLVTTLTGYPFPTGYARIYRLDLSGTILGSWDGYTMLVDIVADPVNQPVVVEYAQFGRGFTPNSGRVSRPASIPNPAFLTGQNFPVAITRAGNTYYVASIATGIVQKLTY